MKIEEEENNRIKERIIRDYYLRGEIERYLKSIILSRQEIYIGQKLYYQDDFRYCSTIIFKLDQDNVFKRYHNIIERSKKAVYVIANNNKELITLGNLQDERKEKLRKFIASNSQVESLYKEESRKEAAIYNTFKSKNSSIASSVFISLDGLWNCRRGRLYGYSILFKDF